mmetsp:Transcript_71082/g.141238  ORF Transcript_71082/g.141238 Transcript_71082/m.141238 type:complete len:86 (-) Transcript_71082:39-296(-)
MSLGSFSTRPTNTPPSEGAAVDNSDGHTLGANGDTMSFCLLLVAIDAETNDSPPATRDWQWCEQSTHSDFSSSGGADGSQMPLAP